MWEHSYGKLSLYLSDNQWTYFFSGCTKACMAHCRRLIGDRELIIIIRLRALAVKIATFCTVKPHFLPPNCLFMHAQEIFARICTGI